MNLDELQSVQSRERQTDSLQQLRVSFYEDAAAFVQELREERERAASKAEDPFDEPDVNRLTDDIRTAEQTVEAIYERRVGKVVKMASLAAADMPTEQEGLTKEEQDLFETMVGAIEDHRETILNVLGGDAPAGAVASTPDHPTEAESAAATDPDDADPIDAADVMGRAESDDDDGADRVETDRPTDERPPTAPDQEPSPEDTEGGGPHVEESTPERATDEPAGTADGSTDDTSQDRSSGGQAVDPHERVTVKITEDVGEIFGVDEREYDLAVDDVVTLPTTNAEPLLDREAAERIE